MSSDGDGAYVFGKDASDLGPASHVCYITFAAVAAIVFLLQIVLLRRLRIMTTYLMLPLLSICVAVENVALYLGSAIDVDHTTSSMYVGYVLNSLIVPLFLLILYELVFKLHEFRNAHFLCFELEVDAESRPAQVLMWIMRIICVGLVAIKLIVEFGWLGVDNKDPAKTGSAGYAYLIDHSHSMALWLALIPSMCLSMFGALVSLYIFKYGTYVALDHGTWWKVSSFAIVGQITGQCFNHNLYAVTSNGGELILLIGLTWCVWLAQYELSMAASYADFLHRSNSAFKAITTVKAEAQRLSLSLSRNSLNKKGLPYEPKSGAMVADYMLTHRESMSKWTSGSTEADDEDDVSTDDEGAFTERKSDLKVHGGVDMEAADKSVMSMLEEGDETGMSPVPVQLANVTVNLSEF